MIIDQLFENNKKPLNEVDPRNFDSDEDFYAAQNAPAKPRYRGQQSPGVNPDDEDYFREIFRKKREAAKKAEQDGEQGVAEGEQLDELSFKDIQRGAKKIGKGAQKFTKNVADTGTAIGGAARDVGGAIKQVGKTAIADPVAAAYNTTKSGLNKAADVAANTYNDVKAGAQKVGQAGATVGTDLGNAAKSVGRGVANVAGGTAGALGATVGGATTGVGRAAAKGFNAGVQNVGGDAVERLQTNIMKQIDAKKTEIAGLEKELARVSTQAPAVSNTVTDQGGAINPDTNQAYTPDEVDAWLEKDKVQRELLPKIKADLGAQDGGAYDLSQPANKMLAKPQAALPTATAAPGAPSKVSYGQGFTKPAAPKPTAVPNYGQQAPGYNYTTSVTPTATPAGTRVTTGGATAAEKAALDKRIAAAAQAQPVAETVKQVKRMMETVTSKADVQRIKDYIDYHMGTNLTESARAKRNTLLSEVTQLAATRRRDIARRMAQ
jgi:hypothetical protein